MHRYLYHIFVLLSFTLTLITTGLILNQFGPPLLQAWKNRFKELGAQYTPYEISIESVTGNLWPIGINISGVKITSKTQSLENLPRIISIDNLKISFELISLLQGKIKLQALEINSATIQGLNLLIEPSNSNGDWIKILNDNILRSFLAEKSHFLLEKIQLKDGSLMLADQRKVRFEIDQLKIDAQYYDESLHISNLSLISQIAYQKFQENFLLSGSMRIDRDGITLNYGQISGEFIKLSLKDSKFGHSNLMIIDQLQISLDRFNSFELLPQRKKQWPFKLAGVFTLQGKASFSKIFSLESFSGNFAIESFELPFVQLGKFRGSISISPNLADINQFSWESSFGIFRAENAEIEIQNWLPVKIRIPDWELKNFDLQSLFRALNFRQIPVWLSAEGNGDCQANFSTFKNWSLQCNTSVISERLLVKGDMNERSPILELGNTRASGNLKISAKEITWEKAQLVFEDTEINCHGSVNFDRGFRIFYDGKNIDLGKVGQIAGISFNGKVKGYGEVWGDSSKAEFFIQAHGTNLKIANFYLNSADFRVNYKNKKLLIDPAKIHFPSGSKVQAAFQISFDRKEVKMISESADLELRDLFFLFSHYLDSLIPYLEQGRGPCRVSFEGPFDWQMWDWQIDYRIKNVKAFSEFIDEAQFQLISQKGYFEVGPSFIRHRNRIFPILGRGHLVNAGFIDITIDQFPLNHSTNISLLNTYISGVMNFRFKIFQPMGDYRLFSELEILSPQFEQFPIPGFRWINEKTKSYWLSKFESEDANLIFDSKIYFDPQSKSSIKIKTQNLNLGLVTPLLNKKYDPRLFSAYLTSIIQVQFPGTHLSKATGSFILQDFHQLANGRQISLYRPITLEINEGLIASPIEFLLLGDRQQKIRLLIDGNIFKPRGELEVNIEMNQIEPWIPLPIGLQGWLSGLTEFNFENDEGANGKFQVDQGALYSAYLPLSLNQLETNLVLKQNQLIISKGRAIVGGGSVEFQGNAKIFPIRQLSLDIPIQVQKIPINDIKGISTLVDGELRVQGTGLPFIMSGNLELYRAFLIKEFEITDQKKKFKPSLILPNLLTGRKQSPLQYAIRTKLNSLIVRNSQADGIIRGEFFLTGDSSTPRLLGVAEIEKNSMIYYQDRIFYIEQGKFTLSEESMNDPQIFLTAITRIERFEITMTVTGTLNNPSVSLTSNPFLPEKELLSLVIFGQLSTDVDRAIQRPGSDLSAAVGIGSALLQNIGLVRQAQKAAGIKIELQTEFNADQNTELRKVVIQKRLSEKSRISAATGDYGFREFRFEYRLSDRLLMISRARQQDFIPNSTQLDRQNRADSVLGLDLEFRKGFK